LIESIGKKANFLKAVADELKLNVVIHNDRIDQVKGIQADIITARALKPLPDLFKLASNFVKKETICLFLKGQNVQEELTESAKKWTFEEQRHQSLSDPSGRVLIIHKLHWKVK
jgi:16S rRNA (guanine527-N7)-methyltransferase